VPRPAPSPATEPTAALGTGERIGNWASSLRYEHLAPHVVQKSLQGVLDTLGVALAGSRHEAAATVAAVVEDLGGRPQSTLLGSRERSSTSLAAFHNAYLAHVLDFDDTHFDAIVHVNAPVLAAALSVAEHAGATGRDFLAAHVAGLEITSRVAIAASVQEDYGWHLTGTAGCFGAAVAAGRLLRLTPREMSFAIGVASTLSSGLRGHRGTMTKAVNPANAANNGVVAAVAAKRGVTSSERILDDPQLGYFTTHGGDYDPLVDADLGSVYRMLDWDPKPYPCGVVIHPSVDAALEVAPLLSNIAAAAAVELRVNPLALSITGTTDPHDGLQAKFSVYHAAATALLEGTLLPAHFEDEWVRDPRVSSLRSAISAEPVDGMPRDEAQILVKLWDGNVVERWVKARGTRARRMTKEEVERKFRQLSEPVLGRSRSSACLAAVTDLPNAQSVAELLNACRPSEKGAEE